MKAAKTAVVLAVLAIATSTAFCQIDSAFSARQLGMGGAAVAVADDAFAWSQNPAGLPNVATSAADGAWGASVAGSYAFSSQDWNGFDLDAWDASASFVDPGKNWGVGGGYFRMSTDDYGIAKLYGFGVGGRFSKAYDQFNWGVSVMRLGAENRAFGLKYEPNWEMIDVVNLGLMYDVRLPEMRPIRVGVTVFDVADEMDRTWTLGASFNAGSRLLIAADFIGAGSTRDRTFVFGGEYRLCSHFCLRAGDSDGQFTCGAGLKHGNLFVDYAHTQKEDERANVVSAGLTF